MTARLRRRRAISLLAGGVLGVSAALGAAVVDTGAAATAPKGATPDHRPLAVRGATFAQDGQQVVWHVTLESRFSVSGLRRAGRSPCRLIERAHNSTVSGVICVTVSRDGTRPALVYQTVTAAGRGRPVPVSATITRGRAATDLTARFLPGSFGNAYSSLRWQVLSTLRAPGCTPLKPNPLGCTTVFPTRPVLTKLHTPEPVACVASGPAYVTNGSRRRHVVALTFDDGPWPITPRFLDVLEHYHVPATFFQIGQQVSTYGRAVDRRMLADGDLIGDHTWSHPNVAGGGAFAADQISRTARAIRAATGFRPCLFRAPGGAVSGALVSEAQKLGFTTIEWDVDPRDWGRPGTGAIYSTVVGHARNGSIILQHDGGGNRAQTLAALPREITTLRRRGFGFVTLTELLGQRLIYR